MLLNENIKQYRTAKGISQVELAKKLGVTKQCVSNWENDNIQPSIEMLNKLADFFSVSTDELLGRTSVATLSLDGLAPDVQMRIRMIVEDLKAARS